ncbi:MAG: molybdopterin-guanine dinucleotide biosynthesis protein B [Gammaproteobacteria bacterium]
MRQPLILGFAAYSGTGKTTLLTHLIPILKKRGLRVGVIKHSHHDFEIDYPGKDSYRLRAAGASTIMIVSPYRKALITDFPTQHEVQLTEQLASFPCEDLDLVLVEGFRDEPFPKIELHRPKLCKPLLYPSDQSIIAIACDQYMTTPPGLPCLDLNDPTGIADFIINRFFKFRQ